ncbi:transposase, partial [Candidatus Binatia bacterium]|nr:transposase [Candidatus Binatia bacterium]
RVEENVDERPKQMVVDGGFVNRENIVALDDKEIELIGPVPEVRSSAGQMQRRGVDEAFYPAAFRYDEATDTYSCPASKTLHYSGKERRIGQTIYQYQAAATDCQVCPFKERCCPTAKAAGRSLTRRVDDAAVQEFAERMETEPAKAIYARRGAVAEFPNLWIKSKLGLRQFRLRGVTKVGMEARWACLTHNVQLWMRRCWRPQWAT